MATNAPRDLLSAFADWMATGRLEQGLKQSLLLPPAMKARLQSEAAANASSISDNPLFAGSLRQTYAGMPVEFSDILPTVIRYDWSDCRSPSRAKRRHARGIKTRVKIIHQDVAYLITKKFEYELQKMYLSALYGD